MMRSDSPINQLNAKLPIFIHSDDVEKHPDLGRLLEDLSHRLTPTGMSKQTDAECNRALHSMKHARQKYLEEVTFYRLVQDVLYNKTNKLKEMRDGLTLSELQDHLWLPGSKSQALSAHSEDSSVSESSQSESQYAFGITPDLVVAKAKAKSSPKGIKEIANKVEEHLENEWMKIAIFIDPVEFISYDPDEMAKIPEKLEVTSRNMKDIQKKLIHSIIQTDYLFLQVHNNFLEYGNMLKALMSKQRLSRHQLLHTESQSVQLAALSLKLQCTEAQILLGTYTRGSIPPLKYIHGHIKERTARAERTLAILKQKLSSFDSLDATYKALLDEYAKIQADIEVFGAGAMKSLSLTN